jgi:hypothetical protein
MYRLVLGCDFRASEIKNLVLCSLDVLVLLRWLILKERNAEVSSAVQVVRDKKWVCCKTHLCEYCT